MNGSTRLFFALCLLASVVFVGLLFWVGGLPPNKIRIATGREGSAFEITGQQIKAILARSGVTVELVRTHGADDNIARLTQTGPDAIDAAILQSGLPQAVDKPGIANLGAIFLEPIWIFGRKLPPGIDVRRLIGKRVGASKPGTAGRNLMDTILAENGMGPNEITILPMTSDESAAALLAGKVDAAWMVSGVKSQWVQNLLASPELELVSFDRAAAYARNHDFLVDVTLAQGAINLARNMPGHDLKLIGPTAQLIVRADLHPALQGLLLDAMREGFARGDAVTPPGMFPNKDLIDIPLSDEARRYYTSGPSFFRRVLPYWAANFAERAVIFLIPLFTLLFPLAQAVPPIYNWRVKNRIQVWYRRLRLLETQGVGARSNEEREDVREKLESMVHELGRTRIPLNFADDVYRLRAHIRFVLDFLTRQTQSASTR